MKQGICVPYALSKITGHSIDWWIEKLISIGARKPGGVGTRLTTKQKYDLGFIPILYDIGSTVKDFPSKVHSAKWLVFIEGHAVAVIDKKIFETANSLDKPVLSAWMYLKS